MQYMFFYCSLCLHLFNLGFQDPSIASQRDSTCNICIKGLLNEPETNAYHSLEYTDGNEFSFDYRLLPLFRKTIEEKIQYAYERIDAKDLDRTSFSSTFTSQDFFCFSHIYRKLFDLLREVYVYEKEVQIALEEQKQATLEKIAQKVNDIALVSQKLGDIVPLTQRTDMGSGFDFEKTEENMKKMAAMAGGVQQQMKNSVESLVVNETINNMKNYSKLISDCLTKYEECRSDKGIGGSFSQNTAEYEKPLQVLEEEIAGRKMPTKHPKFEKILLRFDITLQEISREIDQYFCIYRWDQLMKRVEERLEGSNGEDL